MTSSPAKHVTIGEILNLHIKIGSSGQITVCMPLF